MSNTSRPGRPRTNVPSGPAALIGEKIRVRREAAGLTQQALADASGVSVRVVQDYECGVKREPSVVKLVAIAQALGCTVDEFLS